MLCNGSLVCSLYLNLLFTGDYGGASFLYLCYPDEACCGKLGCCPVLAAGGTAGLMTKERAAGWGEGSMCNKITNTEKRQDTVRPRVAE